ncbi:UNVERIFIED_CONTAM: putative germin-like protein 2-3 [Sesamum calycinum]|uniref:Germin-like protein n=1 Tax=Sesamum calycinum TaxID=2727403 RepID=A0AAW2RV71_9LAMI
MAKTVLLLGIIALNVFCTVFAFGPIPLQDFCVADPASSTRVNGLPCKDPATVQADDFFFSGLHVAGNTTNPFGAALTPVTVTQVPGLNTLGLSIARLDFAPGGFIPPHTHPRATEIVAVLEGSLEVGFVTTNPGYKHFNKVLEKGDVFVVPLGLVHYQRNVGTGNTVAIAALNGQNAGIIAVASAVFGRIQLLTAITLPNRFCWTRKPWKSCRRSSKCRGE